MAPQQSNITIPTTSWLKKQPVKLLGTGVAGFIAIAILLFTSFINSKSTNARTNFSLNKQQCSSQGGASCTEQKKHSMGASTFTLMPGRLTRFLQ